MRSRVCLDAEQVKLLNAMYDEAVQFLLCREYGATSLTTEIQLDYPSVTRIIEIVGMLDRYEREHTGSKARREAYRHDEQEQRDLDTHMRDIQSKQTKIIDSRREAKKKISEMWNKIYTPPKKSFLDRLFG